MRRTDDALVARLAADPQLGPKHAELVKRLRAKDSVALVHFRGFPLAIAILILAAPSTFDRGAVLNVTCVEPLAFERGTATASAKVRGRARADAQRAAANAKDGDEQRDPDSAQLPQSSRR